MPVMSSSQLTAGLSFKPEYFEAAHACSAHGMWFEIHPENYMQAGGPRMAMLDALCERHSVSVHGVGLSLASSELPDAAHLLRLKRVVDRTQAALVSEHLAWSMWRGQYLPDLLPFPRTREALQVIARNIDIVQSVLKRPILVENPSLYVRLDHELDEVDFLSELVRRTGCGLLVDVNNVHVSAHNLCYDSRDYLRRIPTHAVGEVHLAGHSHDVVQSDQESHLLIDSHSCAVDEAVWTLYADFIARIGARPTLIERDDNLPEFPELMLERERAASLLAMQHRERPHVCAG
jgi:uncharacterized protein